MTSINLDHYQPSQWTNISHVNGWGCILDGKLPGDLKALMASVG